jgi:hypothetical protein
MWPTLRDHAGVFIHPVTDRDADAIVALWREVFPEYDDPTRPQRDPRASIARKLAFGDGLFWLAEEETGARAFWRSVGYVPDAVVALGKRLG